MCKCTSNATVVFLAYLKRRRNDKPRHVLQKDEIMSPKMLRPTYHRTRVPCNISGENGLNTEV